MLGLGDVYKQVVNKRFNQEYTGLFTKSEQIANEAVQNHKKYKDENPFIKKATGNGNKFSASV